MNLMKIVKVSSTKFLLRTFFAIMFLMLMPAPIFAAEQNTGGYEACDYVLDGGSTPPSFCDYERNQSDAIDVVGNVLNTVYFWIGILAIVFIIIGGVHYTTSQGDPGKVAKAKSTILYAIIGLVIALLAFAITTFVLNSLSGTTGGGGGGSGGGSETPVEIESITVAESEISIKEGETAQISVKFHPGNVNTNTALKYESSDSTIASVSLTGKITAKNPGDAIITVTTRNGKKAEVAVTVIPIIRADSIAVEPSSLELEVGQTATLSATIKPPETEDKTVTWSSNNRLVAIVDTKGKVTAKALGTATITAQTSNGKTATVKVTVKLKKAKVLWVGNSKTYVQDIDRKFVSIMSNLGYEIDSTRVSAGGSTLLENYNSRGANIHKAYDYVFLQEQTDTSLDESTFYSGALAIAKAVKAKNSDVKVYVRKTWYLNNSGSSTISSVNSIASNVSRRIASDAGVWSSTVSDGNAMYKAQSKGYTVFGDDRHQNKLGAYLVAACAAVRVFKVDATKISTDAGTGFGNSTLKDMQKIANDECSK